MRIFIAHFFVNRISSGEAPAIIFTGQDSVVFDLQETEKNTEKQKATR